MIRNILSLAIVIVFFSGCISVTKELPPFTTYTLFISQNEIKHTKNINKSIAVIEPKAIHSVNNILISYADEEYRSENYVLSKWSDKPTKILQQTMINYLNSTKNYNYVHGNNLKLPSDIKILSELDTFTQYLKGDKSFVKFSIRVFLVQENRLNSKTFTYTQQCSDQSAKGSVKALNSAVSQFVEELDAWILSNN